jgi:2,4-dienoyl-CoA reductase-like NADH-dependent reductase (Old Yellow Enzyme family)
MVQGLTKLVKAVHHVGGKIAFQLAHCGRQTKKNMIGQIPLGPSSRGRDPQNFVKPKEMTENEIKKIIKAFVEAADRTVEAGADAIQLHGAHGYLISEFLSPYFNIRTDAWGGSDENRFRFLGEICQGIKIENNLNEQNLVMV